jgi:hypothetical protein
MAVDEFFDEDFVIVEDDLDDDYLDNESYFEEDANDLYSDLDGWNDGLRWDDGS